ncbi:Subtilisin DY [Pontiella desulfatans]|uniref:Subtilisin DY n=1 Tax=Pontiella desulfatans TaxID=2750659 RepID=A0A6C2UBK4_PONDE|nr:S8 family serine peptidase [Pontiella desulfatans]VGO16744.1 Subtilisin DY [Pontiella desulfatans]
MAASASQAQQISLFEEKPFEREAFALQLAEKASTDKEAARVWALANNKPMRVDDGRQVMELMAVRNGKPVYYITHNSNAAISSAANKVRTTAPYNLDGAGINVGVWDAGAVRTSHQEFDSGRAVVKDGYTTTHYHATHVAGTIGAKGVQTNAKGMAPSASIHSYYWNSDISEMTTAAATAPGQTGNKIYLSNHSYGQGVGWTQGTFYDNRDEFGQYNSEARTVDQVLYNAQYYLPFWSSGNDRTDGTSSSSPVGDGYYKGGYDIISHEAIGKNVMTVGAVNDAVSGGNRYPSAGTYTSFTSWGPADDGRIKPDIVANGYQLYSTDDDDDSDYTTLSGTSMSSPSACGSAALLVEYYKELFSGGAMRASTLKGLIIHTATDLGRAGPDYQYGWGLMNTLAAAQLLEDYASGSLNRLREDSLSSTANPSDSFVVSASGEPFRVTLCWTDPPGTAQSGDDIRTPALVNDLDLTITGPGGTRYPYTLSYASPAATATTGDNDVDNVEQIYVASPTPGIYTITINYEGSSLSGGTQRYSLFIDGVSSDSDGDQMPDYWEQQYFSSTTGAVATADSDGDGTDNLTEYIAGTLPNNPNSVFKVTSYSANHTGGTPFVVNWTTEEGRVYSVSYTYNLKYVDFAPFPDATDLPSSQNSYTDTVSHAVSPIFYRVDVKIGE